MKICIFSGTNEGRELCGFLSVNGAAAETEAYVATEYGAEPLEKINGITIHRGRLEAEEMALEFGTNDLVIDATHPYAVEVTRNLRTACQAAGAEYWRLVRPGLSSEYAETVPDTEAAVSWLDKNQGKALLTTGSKELEAFTRIKDYRERVYVRVLPSVEAIKKCEGLGFRGSHIIAMQGPFSHEMNVAVLRSTGAGILVTKDTGETGGFRTKISAARETGAKVLVIARPHEEDGMTLSEIKACLSKRLGLGNGRRFPLFVPLRNRRCVIFGAGKIAERRFEVLQRFGAEVRVIAPESRSGIAPDEERGYEENDLEGVFLAVAATDSREVNRRIGSDCLRRNVPCSVADSAEESTFFFPAICEGREFTAGVVSKGKCHHKTAEAARRIRKILEELDGTD